MCGIAGYFVRGGAAQPAVIQRMCDVIRHRGPDDEGFHVEGGCAIGMRRLAIIDLHTGHQPISNEDGTVWIVFNGEIYQYRHLRTELESRGHRFKTASDTETILHLYEEWGVEGLNRLRGMFAFAIWDSRRQELLLVRDRFGKKPLYFAANDGGLWFGSELKALAAGGCPMETDEEALQLYGKWLYIPDPFTPYRHVRRLPPGGWLRFGAHGPVTQGRYWRMPVPAERPPAGLSRADAVERIRELFDEAVKIRMIADVPLGAFLSGGLDSGSVVASMARQSAQPVKTFSIGFEEAGFSELPLAGMVAEQYHTEHHQILVKPDAVSLVEKLVQGFDEPFGDSSAIPTFIVSEFARRHVTVALSGDGGDEFFGGYPSLWEADANRRWDRVPVWLRGVWGGVADALPYAARGKNFLRAISRPNAVDRYLEARGWPHYLQQRIWRHSPAAGDAHWRRVFPDCFVPPGADIVTQAVYWEATADLTGDMLVKVDRMSSANSLEVRCPMLDHHFAEFALSLPPQWKFGGGKGKLILREALGDRLPPALLTAPKKGFAVPLAEWFRTSLKDFLRDHLLGETFRARGVAQPRAVEQMIDEHLSGRRNNYHFLWALLMLELWFRHRTGPAWTAGS
jgi:asparagine synthase (glutamine-hydrolysing)